MDYKEKNLKKLQWYEEELLMWQNRFEVLGEEIIKEEKIGSLLTQGFKIIRDCRVIINQHKQMNKRSVLAIFGAEHFLNKIIKEFKEGISFSVEMMLADTKLTKEKIEQFKNKFKA